MEEETSALTLRLGADQARELKAVARVNGVSVNEAIRVAIADHIEKCRRDKVFKARLEDMFEEDKEIFERLATR
ncbi:MAG: ribbon-helix-helix protein, CopG family [Actinomycetota bacterium]